MTLAAESTYPALQDYNITLKAYYSGSDVTATDTLTLRAVGSPLEAHLSGLSGSVPMLQGNLTYDASESRDPDDPDDAATEMSYLWSCYNTVDRSPCFGMQQGTATWVLDPSKVYVNPRNCVGSCSYVSLVCWCAAHVSIAS